MYRCEATSVEGFIQQLAVSYVANGYWFYVTGTIPEGKDPRNVDAKLIARYGIDISKWSRYRRKRFGVASVQYLRYERFFVILATQGRHKFFSAEACVIKDIRRVPLKFAGYSVSYRRGRRRWHASVRIAPKEYQHLKARFLSLAVHRAGERLAVAFSSVPIAPYAPVRTQLLNILHAVNRRRETAGFESVPRASLRFRRKSVSPFKERRTERF